MTELLIITIGYTISMLVGVGFGLFVLIQARKVEHVTFFLMCASLAGYQLSFILAINTPPSLLAYWFWFANLVDIFLAIFYLHFIIVALDAYERWKRILWLDYAIGFLILGTAFLYPSQFLPEITPKMYFLSYLDGGPLYLVMLAFFFISFAFSFIVMFEERTRHSEEGKRRIDYYIFSLFYGFFSGITAFPLVFNIRIDPLPSILLGTFTIPMVYGMMKKDLLSIRIVVQRTVLFTVAIGGIVALLTLLPFLSSGISSAIPGAGFWLVPLFIALGAVSVATLYWQKAEETERLKYEFITVVAHKFRTPLTRIRWATESLLTRVDLPPDVIERVQQMKEADLALIQLSNLLIDAARMDREDYSYAKSNISLLPIVEEVLATYRSAVTEKHLMLTYTPPASVPEIRGDKERLASVISVLVENAIAYTPPGGSIATMLLGAPDQVRFQITDTGIGVTDEERHHIFKKFYRTDRARHADTEGVGLGLHMAKNIIDRHRGSIGVESPGVGQGSTFWFTLPSLPKES